MPARSCWPAREKTMSNLWSREYTASAASVGSFALDRSLPMFTPWGASDEAPRTANDRDEAQPDAAATPADSFAQGFDACRRTAELAFPGDTPVTGTPADAMAG